MAIVLLINDDVFLNYIHFLYNRRTHIDMGNGNCKWTPPEYESVEDEHYLKTVIAGFPSDDKILTLLQLEELTEHP
eukprot:10218534-Ditylum_brightwellii.AAC.1